MKGLLLSSVFVGVLLVTGASLPDSKEPSQYYKPEGAEGAFGGLMEGDKGSGSSVGAGGGEEADGSKYAAEGSPAAETDNREGEDQGRSEHAGGVEEADHSKYVEKGPAEGNENHESGDDQGSSNHPRAVEEGEDSRFIAGEGDHSSEGSHGAGYGRRDYGETPEGLGGARGGRREGYGAHNTHNGHHWWNSYHTPPDWIL